MGRGGVKGEMVEDNSMANLTYVVSRHQNVSSCQVSVDKTFIGEILHT